MYRERDIHIYIYINIILHTKGRPAARPERTLSPPLHLLRSAGHEPGARSHIYVYIYIYIYI